MNFYVLFITILIIIHNGLSVQVIELECGKNSFLRQPRDELFIDEQNATSSTIKRTGRIISGRSTQEGQFPWQVSLELLHPSWGFLGHWCGGVLIDRDWILSAAHCVHNDLFNLPLPALWTAVLGEYNRHIESGTEQRISIEKIVMHDRYHNFQNDLVLMKLSRSADLTTKSKIQKICLPCSSFRHDFDYETVKPVNVNVDIDLLPHLIRDNNYLRMLKYPSADSQEKTPVMRNINLREKIAGKVLMSSVKIGARQSRKIAGSNHRRNDKFLQDVNLFKRKHELFASTLKKGGNQDFPYSSCIATGWGKADIDGDLTDILLQTKVPIHESSRCQQAYGDFVKIHKGHLCAGRLDGKGGTCVGDSGGPLQCRLGQKGPWILAGVTSFGSGCAQKGYPDVYTKISHYINWITETITTS